MPTDAFGRAVADQFHGDREEPLLQRDGAEVLEHPIEEFYFGEFSAETEGGEWLAGRLDGPLLDMGAGAGKHALYFQEHHETVAIEPSDSLVELMRERGVEDARQADMFALRETFDRDRFQSALAFGTQLGLAGSMDGLRRFLGDLAAVTRPDANAVLDSYDPETAGTGELLGYRADPTPGLAFRVMTFEYEDEADEILLFRLFSPDRLAEATIGTAWKLAETRRGGGDNDYHYLAALEKT
jgi:hypothetical protein